MSDGKKDGHRTEKQHQEMREHEHEIEKGREAHAHNPATDVGQVTSSSSMREHGLQNKEVNKQHEKEVDIHSDDKNERHTHIPKVEQMEHDLKAEESKKA